MPELEGNRLGRTLAPGLLGLMKTQVHEPLLPPRFTGHKDRWLRISSSSSAKRDWRNDRHGAEVAKSK
jgi:hypothetical protein